MQRHGWTLLFHDCLLRQLQRLSEVCERTRAAAPSDWQSNANAKLFHALSRLMLETIPSDPSRSVYRQGTTLGKSHRHWRRAKIGRRFRLFFRYDSTAKIIIYAWVNDEKTLRQAHGKTDPYAVFQKMLAQGYPPDSWNQLLIESESRPFGAGPS
ncbi:toxin YhaV [Desulfonatronum thiosulfatophilum]|uniref:Toxin YhaV n=1 Tax=Desulfonatronum thiosulfatophilum TaxID=617002 RepID=A0A1G6DLF0_9BACT|nr:type II toxin-antitoxin system YhaV family toxin [Desulfonatronum thiosulfatophilum]SDB45993.1 toxin YhaV [Desulfonatronum thiosulfatophilum]